MITNQSVYSKRTIYLVIVATLASVCLIVLGLWSSYDKDTEVAKTIDENLYYDRLNYELRHLDHILTTSTYMTAATGDLKWVEQYNVYSSKLDNVLLSLAAISPDIKAIVNQITEANKSLLKMEANTFGLVRAGRIDQARAVVVSKAYQEAKNTYVRKADKIRKVLIARANTVNAYSKKMQQGVYVIFGVLLLVLLVVWSYVVTILLKWRKGLIDGHLKLSELAHEDALTGIANRIRFQNNLKVAFRSARRNGNSIALLLLDLDHFKDINDTFGHDVGDELLKLVATQFTTRCRDTDTVARLGGDEFAVIAADVKDRGDLVGLAEGIIEICSSINHIEGHSIRVGVSIGIAFFPEDAESEAELLRYADLALYKSKRQGRNCYSYFDNNLEGKVRHRQKLEIELKEAIEKSQFVLHYQPIFNVVTEAIEGVEALIRWQHPEQGLIQPADFLPVAECSGLIVPLGQWVVEQACREQSRWASPGNVGPFVSVNLSSRQFEGNQLPEVVFNAIKQSGISANRLVLELTETVLMEDQKRVLKQLKALRDKGVRIAVDDFGTGYSSLSYLQRFPVDYLKIDRSFLQGLPADVQSKEIASAIIHLGVALNLSVVAEGVEDLSQLRFLQENNCGYAQGFYLGQPMTAQQFDKLRESVNSGLLLGEVTQLSE